MEEEIKHISGAAGGYLVGRSHANNGIKAINKATGKPLEMEGGEVVITKTAVEDDELREFEGEMLTNRQILSKINESGGGVSFALGGDIPTELSFDETEYSYGGEKLPGHQIAYRISSCGCKHQNDGLSEDKTIEDVATMHNVSVEHIENQLLKGIEVESEHSDNFETKMQIAMDHLVENPNYYDILEAAQLEKGGMLTDSEKESLYNEWKELVNMSASSLKSYYDSEDGEDSGLSEAEAKDQGIKSGRESARWIIKMKETNVSNWTPEMWKWAKRQISFIKRMKGVEGKLYDDNGNKTRKHKALLIWGHNPEIYEKGGNLKKHENDDNIDNVTQVADEVLDGPDIVASEGVYFEKGGFLPADIPEKSRADIAFLVDLQDRKQNNRPSGGWDINLFKSSFFNKVKKLPNDQANVVLDFLTALEETVGVKPIFSKNHKIWENYIEDKPVYTGSEFEIPEGGNYRFNNKFGSFTSVKVMLVDAQLRPSTEYFSLAITGRKKTSDGRTIIQNKPLITMPISQYQAYMTDLKNRVNQGTENFVKESDDISENKNQTQKPSNLDWDFTFTSGPSKGKKLSEQKLDFIDVYDDNIYSLNFQDEGYFHAKTEETKGLLTITHNPVKISVILNENDILSSQRIKRRLKKLAEDSSRKIVINPSSSKSDRNLFPYLFVSERDADKYELANDFYQKLETPRQEFRNQLSKSLKREPKFKVGDFVKYETGDLETERWVAEIKEVKDFETEFAYRIDAYTRGIEAAPMFDAANKNEIYEAQLKPSNDLVFNEAKKHYNRVMEKRQAEKQTIPDYFLTTEEYLNQQKQLDSYPVKDKLWENNTKAHHVIQVKKAISKPSNWKGKEYNSIMAQAVIDGKITKDRALLIIGLAGLDDTYEIENIKLNKNQPFIGQILDFGEGLEKITRLVQHNGIDYIEAIKTDGSDNRLNLYPLADFQKTLENQDIYKGFRELREKQQLERFKYLQEKEELEKSKTLEYNDIDGFAEDRTPLEKGKILKFLNNSYQIDGKITTRKQDIRKVINENNGFVNENSQKEKSIRYIINDNTFLMSDEFQTKYGIEYAEYLISKRDSKNETHYSISNYRNPYEVNRAIEKLIDSKESGFTPNEIEFISNYSGYGGLEKQGSFSDEELKGLLYEYFTPDAIVKKMWALAYKYGFGTIENPHVMEPSVGTGNFFKYAPINAELFGNEINRFSKKVCEILYPNAMITLQPFEKNFISKNNSIKNKLSDVHKYHLVIGNPPYGRADSKFLAMGEKDYTKASNFTEYFITRGLDLLHPGGLLIFVVGAEQYNGGTLFLDSGISSVKKNIFDKAQLVDAYRLPTKIFERTGVASEILVFKKK